MSNTNVFIIPVKKQQNLVTEDSRWGHLILRDTPGELRQHAQQVVSGFEKRAMDEATTYINTLNNTYAYLMLKIKENIGRELCVGIKSEKVDEYREPTLEKWATDNPAKMFALSLVVAQLTTSGWSPRVTLSLYRYDTDDHFYTGGDEAILTCSFID